MPLDRQQPLDGILVGFGRNLILASRIILRRQAGNGNDFVCKVVLKRTELAEYSLANDQQIEPVLSHYRATYPFLFLLPELALQL